MSELQENFPLEKYSLCNKIGEGAFAKVFKYKINSSDENLPQNVAVKVIEVHSDFFSTADLIPMLEMPHHENIVQVFGGFYQMDRQLTIVMELCQCNLKDFAVNNVIDERLMIKFSIEAVRSIKHIHHFHHIL